MEKEWTIIFLIYADFRKDGTEKLDTDLKREFKELMKDFERCALSEKFEILLIRNIINPNPSGKDCDITQISRLVEKPDRRQNDFALLEKFETPLIVQKEKALADIFTKIHSNQYDGVITRAKRYFLNTWDHGSVFGVFRRNVTNDDVLSDTTEVAVKILDLDTDQKAVVPLLRQEILPVSFMKNEEGDYIGFKRYWEKPVYRYMDSQKKPLFELNSNNIKHQVYNKLLSDHLLNQDIRILKTVKEVAIEIPEYNSYEIDVLDKDEVLVTRGKQKDKTEGGLEDGKNKSTLCKLLEIKEEFQISDTIRVSLETMPEKILDILTNEELQRAIDAGFSDRTDKSGGKVDVLLMMNCYLMNVHSCYAFRNSVKYLIAPQGLISEPGYNYSFLFKEIIKSVNRKVIITDDEMAGICVSSCGYELSAKRRKFQNEIERWAIMAVNLEDYDFLAEKINVLANELIKMCDLSPLVIAILNAVRNNCVRFDTDKTSYFVFDFLHWISQSIVDLDAEKIDTNFLVKAYIEMQDFIEAKIIAERIGSRIYAGVNPNLIIKKPKTTCIYFPGSENKDEEFRFFIDRNSQNQSSFLREKKDWLNFLDRFLLGIVS